MMFRGPCVSKASYAATRGQPVRSVAKETVISMAAKQALVPIANGSEEMEAVIIIDVLRRAGVEVDVASVEEDLKITASRGVKLVADKFITDCDADYDAIILPGGMPGAERLRDCEHLAKLLSTQKASGRLYAAICAAPAIVFESQGLIPGVKATAHPAFSSSLNDQSSVEERVVVDGICTTSRGPGTAFEFALSMVEQLCGSDKKAEVAGPMVMYKTD